MPLRRKNLLDALRQATGPEGGALSPPVQPARPPEAAVRPLETPSAPARTPVPPAPPAPAPEPPRAAPPVAPRPVLAPAAPGRTATTSRRPLLLVLVGAAVVVLAIVLWRRATASGDGEAQASAPSAPSSDSAALQSPKAGYTKHDVAFEDRRNTYTIRVATYKNDDNGMAAALAAYRYLDDNGLPVVHPIRSGDEKQLWLCVGYHADKSGLADLQKYVTRMRGWQSTKKPPFDGAYVLPIDDVIVRR